MKSPVFTATLRYVMLRLLCYDCCAVLITEWRHVMARVGVTYEEYEVVANKLAGEGIKPTVRKVRAELGTGSYGTLLTHHNQYQGIQHFQSHVAHEIPEAFVQAIKKALGEAGRVATEASESALIEARAQLKEDEAQLNDYEFKIEEQAAVIERHLATIQQNQIELESALSASESQHAEQSAHLKDLSDRLDNALKQSSLATTEAAKAQLQLNRADTAVELAEKRADSAGNDNEQLKKEAISAEKRAATAEAVSSEKGKAIAKLEGDLSRSYDERIQAIEKLEQALSRAREENESMRNRAGKQQDKLDDVSEAKAQAEKSAAVFETENIALKEQAISLKAAGK